MENINPYELFLLICVLADIDYILDAPRLTEEQYNTLLIEK